MVDDVIEERDETVVSSVESAIGISTGGGLRLDYAKRLVDLLGMYIEPHAHIGDEDCFWSAVLFSMDAKPHIVERVPQSEENAHNLSEGRQLKFESGRSQTGDIEMRTMQDMVSSITSLASMCTVKQKGPGSFLKFLKQVEARIDRSLDVEIVLYTGSKIGSTMPAMADCRMRTRARRRSCRTRNAIIDWVRRHPRFKPEFVYDMQVWADRTLHALTQLQQQNPANGDFTRYRDLGKSLGEYLSKRTPESFSWTLAPDRSKGIWTLDDLIGHDRQKRVASLRQQLADGTESRHELYRMIEVAERRFEYYHRHYWGIVVKAIIAVVILIELPYIITVQTSASRIIAAAPASIAFCLSLFVAIALKGEEGRLNNLELKATVLAQALNDNYSDFPPSMFTGVGILGRLNKFRAAMLVLMLFVVLTVVAFAEIVMIAFGLFSF